MSDREFENYLTLLASLLRLDPQQRGAVADELRSHMEDRLDELMARGVPRDEAVKQALAEFGDAAGLAGQFLAIKWNRKRRWLMRVTTFSIAATLLIATGIAIFWPGRNAAPGPAAAIAQSTEQKKEAAPTELKVLKSEKGQSLEDKLDKRMEVNFQGVPLWAALDRIADQTDIQFYIAKKKLEEASVSEDTPVTQRFKHVRVETLLRLMLKELELTYVDRDDLIVVTTPEDAESELLTRVYDCRDLLAMPAPDVPRGPATTVPSPAASDPNASATPSSLGGIGVAGSGEAPQAGRGNSGGMLGRGGSLSGGVQRRPPTELEKRTDEIIELTISTIQPDSWDDVGGPGAIDAYNGLFVVSQTAEVHKQVEHLFDMLRQAAGLEVTKTGKVVR
jgi:hypothetical protein